MRTDRHDEDNRCILPTNTVLFMCKISGEVSTWLERFSCKSQFCIILPSLSWSPKYFLSVIRVFPFKILYLFLVSAICFVCLARSVPLTKYLITVLHFLAS
jgi:hypothetical protein